MNNLIYITGAPCCGKTTFALKLQKYENISFLSLDALSKSLRSVFKNFNMYSGKVCIQPDLNRDVFLELVCKYCENYFADFPKNTLVVEGCHFTPEEFYEKFPTSKILCLGVSDSKDRIFSFINKKAWMAGLDENIKAEYADKIFHYSKRLKENSKKFYMYYETGKTNLNEIYKFIFEGDKNV